MKYSLAIFLVSFFLINSCSSDDPIDLTYLCPKGDIWLVNKSDSFKPNHQLDSFINFQGAGYHRFAFSNSFLNKIYVDVKAIPSKDSTIIYKKQYIEKINVRILNNDYIYLNDRDNMLSITNKGSYFLVHIEPISIYSSGNVKTEFRACSLKMTDSLP